MVKGVNKKIIEINHPDSLYFDRAVFYLKPGITQVPYQLSQADSYAILREASPADQKRKPGWVRTAVLMILSCVMTAALCFLLR